jgi:hypothetical protein
MDIHVVVSIGLIVLKIIAWEEAWKPIDRLRPEAKKFAKESVSFSFRLLPWTSSVLRDVSWPKKHHRPKDGR